MQSHCHITELVMATSHKQAPWHQKCKLSSFQQFFFSDTIWLKRHSICEDIWEKKEVYIEKIYKHPSFFSSHPVRYRGMCRPIHRIQTKLQRENIQKGSNFCTYLRGVRLPAGFTPHRHPRVPSPRLLSAILPSHSYTVARSPPFLLQFLFLMSHYG